MKIKKDEDGVYARVDGYICRPTEKTIFCEGDVVRGSHPAGDSAYIRRGKRGCSEYVEEIWKTTCCHWWHPIEGRGKESEELRKYDLERNPGMSEDAHKEKLGIVSDPIRCVL